jgi:hypothetical protein
VCVQAAALGRLGSLVEAVAWHASADLLVGLAGGRLLLWADPGVLAADKALLEATKTSLDVRYAAPRPRLVPVLHCQSMGEPLVCCT